MASKVGTYFSSFAAVKLAKKSEGNHLYSKTTCILNNHDTYNHEINYNCLLTILSSSGPLTEIKLIPASFAMALATRVLPQPGGPTSKTPVGESRLNSLAYSKNWKEKNILNPTNRQGVSCDRFLGRTQGRPNLGAHAHVCAPPI